MDRRKIALWLDRSRARFITPDPETHEIKTILSDYDPRPREEGEEADGTFWGIYASSNEDRKHHKLQAQLDDYYKVLEELLQEYDEILLFGPSTAKSELKNRLEADRHFANKIIHTANAGEMTEHQLMAFVRNHFS